MSEVPLYRRLVEMIHFGGVQAHLRLAANPFEDPPRLQGGLGLECRV